MNQNKNICGRAEIAVKGFFKEKSSTACIKGFVIFAVLSYLYFVTNDLNNYDNVSVLLNGYGTGVSSGRWFLQILGDLMGKLGWTYNIPMFNALAGLCCLLPAVLLIIRILKISDPGLCFGMGAVTAAFPTIAASMFFSFTVHYYFLAFLLGTAGVFLAQKTKWHRAASVVLLALSLGIYQAYFPFLAVLLVLSLIRDTLDDGIRWDGIVKNAVIYLAVLVMGYILYLAMSKLCLAFYDSSLNNYRGMSSMGKVSIGDLPWMLKLVYRHFFLLVEHDYCGVSATPVIRLCIAASFLVTAFCVVLGWKNRKWLKNLELCFLIFILPIAANSMIIMVPTGGIYTLMVMGLIAVFYLPAVMAQNVQLPKKAGRGIALFMSAVLLLAAGDYAYQSNGNYRSLVYQNKVTENYYTVMFSRVKSMEGYHEDMEVVFLGDEIQDNSLSDAWEYLPFRYGGKSAAAGDAINEYSRPAFIQYYLGYTTRYATREEISRYSSQFAEEECYPNDGSVKLLDGIVFINCGTYSENYEMLIED